MPKQMVTVGAAIAAFLEDCGVKAAFGVISIHNMPILDAIAERKRIRFVMARGEAGGAGMADGYARTTGTLGVCFTSTGTAAGNAAGALVEAQTAGTPLLHLTGQIDSGYVDKGLAYLHEANDQLNMLKAISKAAFRVRSAETAIGIVRQAVQLAMTAPAGPVSVEIPIDIQAAMISMPADCSPAPVSVPVPPPLALDALANKLAESRRPLLWLGGGARRAGGAVARLVAMGFGVVTSTQGRGVLAEDHPASLGAFCQYKSIEALYQTCDALLVVGSRLRGNETLKYELNLPKPLFRVDADPSQEGRGYESDIFVCGDAELALAGIADRLQGRMETDPKFIDELGNARRAAERMLMDGLGPYATLVEQLQAFVGREFNWVRDVTISNSTWGNRQLRIFDPKAGVHAQGGGIGQGLAMSIGTAVGATEFGSRRKTFLLVGDGGLVLGLGELACASQEKVDIVVILMNDQRYGVIRNIQDAQYGGRRAYVDLHTPDYGSLCSAIGGIRHAKVTDLKAFKSTLEELCSASGPAILEVDMNAIGDFKAPFAGPPSKSRVASPA